MRTKTLLCAAALAAGVVTSMAQSNVYSLNIVGYVNVPVQGNSKLTLISDPLKPSNGNYNITNTMPTLPSSAQWDGATIFKWAGTAWDNNSPGYIDGFGWYPDAVINLGEAFFIQAPSGAPNISITFVGEVATGNITNSLPTGISVVADKIPLVENWPGATVGNDGDVIFTWTGSAWDNTTWSYIGGYGWDNGGNPGNSTNGPSMPIGVGVVYQNTGPALNWVRAFNP